MKLDPGMHIGLHLVFFGKLGVTRRKSQRLSCCQHVRLSGEDPQSFGDSPFAWRIFSPETHVIDKLECIRC
jgi:hypothetical protein